VIGAIIGRGTGAAVAPESARLPVLALRRLLMGRVLLLPSKLYLLPLSDCDDGPAGFLAGAQRLASQRAANSAARACTPVYMAPPPYYGYPLSLCTGPIMAVFYYGW